jgi:hypothetical protein
MKENKVKAIGILKVVLRIVSATIFVASVFSLIKILTPKKKEVEKTEEIDDFDDYVEDVNLGTYNFPEEDKDEEPSDSDDTDEFLRDLDEDEEYDEDDDDDDEDEELAEVDELLKGAKDWGEDLL